MLVDLDRSVSEKKRESRFPVGGWWQSAVGSAIQAFARKSAGGDVTARGGFGALGVVGGARLVGWRGLSAPSVWGATGLPKVPMGVAGRKGVHSRRTALSQVYPSDLLVYPPSPAGNEDSGLHHTPRYAAANTTSTRRIRPIHKNQPCSLSSSCRSSASSGGDRWG